jgi:hypothetical protein
VTTTLKVLATALVLYLLLGAWFAAGAQPQQLWACPAPEEPHAQILQDQRLSPECRPTVTTRDRVEQFTAATVFGIPFTIIKAVNGGA